MHDAKRLLSRGFVEATCSHVLNVTYVHYTVVYPCDRFINEKESLP